MSTYQSISDLYYRYAQLIDKGELSAVAKLMGDCKIIDPNGNTMAEGEQQIFDMYKALIRIYDDGTPHTQHVVSNLQITADGNGATTRTCANYTVMQKMSSGEIKTIICGEYKGLFCLLDDQWTFKEHQLIPTLVGDMSEHLLIDMGL